MWWKLNDVFFSAVKVVPVFDHQSILLCERVTDEMGKHSFLKLELNFTRYVDFELEIALQWPFCDSNPCHELLPRSSILHRTFVMTQNLFFGFYLVESLCEWKNSSSASWVWIKLNGDHNFDIELYQLVITVLFSATLTMPRIFYSNFCCDLLPRHDFSHDR